MPQGCETLLSFIRTNVRKLFLNSWDILHPSFSLERNISIPTFSYCNTYLWWKNLVLIALFLIVDMYINLTILVSCSCKAVMV